MPEAGKREKSVECYFLTDGDSSCIDFVYNLREIQEKLYNFWTVKIQKGVYVGKYQGLKKMLQIWKRT